METISEECSDEYEDISCDEEESENEEEKDKHMRLQCELQLTGNNARVKGLQDLRQLYQQFNHRLTWAKDDGEEENKALPPTLVVDLVEDEFKEKKDIKVFEKMEKLTGRPSFGSRSSIVEQFMADKMCLDSTRSEIAENEEEDDSSGEEEIVVPSPNPLTEDSSSEDEELEAKSDRRVEESNSSEEEDDERENQKTASLQRLTQVVRNELGSMKKLRKKIEETELHLLEAKKEFQKYKVEEEAKLKKEKLKLSKEASEFKKLKTEVEKLRKTNLEQTSTISQLEERLKNTNLEWSKKLNGWNLARTKLKSNISELEKKCKELEAKASKPVAIKVPNPGKPTQPPKSIKRIQFEGISPILKVSNNVTIKPQQRIPLKATKSIQFNNEEQNDKENNDSSSKMDDEPLRSFGEQEEFSKLNGAVEKLYPNGIRKYVCKEKNLSRTMYKNGDIKEIRPDGSIHYFFATLGLRHYIYPNGLEMTTYKNGQIQRKNPDGTVEVLYPNSCVRVTRPNGKEEFIFPDNTVYQQDDQGNTVILLPNGQKEIHNELFKKRTFPDGTTKTVFSDGSIETKYCNGRIRLKSAEGKLLSDTLVPAKDNTTSSLSPS